MRRYLPPVVAAIALTAGLQTASPADAQGHGHTDGESVLAWNEIAVGALVTAGPAAVPGPVGPLYLTYVHRAVHDAVDHLPHQASFEAAVAAAAHAVLTHYFPAQQASLDTAYDGELALIEDGESEALGVAFGERAASKLIREREGDGLNGPALPLDQPPHEPGVWTPESPTATAAAASWLGTVEPFVLRSPSQFRPGPPPALTSDRYAKDYEEVRTRGNAVTPSNPTTARTAEQTAKALFWADPPAVQSQRALRGYAVQEELDGEDTAWLFALVNTASADALIACADAKFEYDFWRPFSAIPAAASDGNPATEPQVGWTSLVPTPNFPEYPSNHSCATTAIATVIDGVDDDFEYTVESWRGTPPALAATVTFHSADEMIAHVADGRVYGGLHWRFSTEVGTGLGRAVAEKVLRAEG
jgi:hypothetical protein